MEKILTVSDVANILQVKAITVREMFREKRIRGFKVGKAWRTTEAMLQEDIDALARGESPQELPTPGPQKSKRDTAPTSGPATSPDKKAKAVKGTPRRGETRPIVETPEKTTEETPEKSKKTVGSSTSDDDTQQMLF